MRRLVLVPMVVLLAGCGGGGEASHSAPAPCAARLRIHDSHYPGAPRGGHELGLGRRLRPGCAEASRGCRHIRACGKAVGGRP